MENFKIMLIEERDYLTKKVGDLDAFTKTDKFLKIDLEQQFLISVQLDTMKAYYKVLIKRTRLMEIKNPKPN